MRKKKGSEEKPLSPAKGCTGGRGFLGAARDQEHPWVSLAGRRGRM